MVIAAAANSAQRSADRHVETRKGPPGALGTKQAAGRPPTATLAGAKAAPKGMWAYAQGVGRAVPVEERVALTEGAGKRVAADPLPVALPVAEAAAVLPLLLLKALAVPDVVERVEAVALRAPLPDALAEAEEVALPVAEVPSDIDEVREAVALPPLLLEALSVTEAEAVTLPVAEVPPDTDEVEEAVALPLLLLEVLAVPGAVEEAKALALRAPLTDALSVAEAEAVALPPLLLVALAVPDAVEEAEAVVLRVPLPDAPPVAEAEAVALPEAEVPPDTDEIEEAVALPLLLEALAVPDAVEEAEAVALRAPLPDAPPVPVADNVNEAVALPLLLLVAEVVLDAVSAGEAEEVALPLPLAVAAEVELLEEDGVAVPLAPTHRSDTLLHSHPGAHSGAASSVVQAGP